MRHIQDNRYRHVIHTMAPGTSQLVSYVKYEEVRESTKSIFNDIITKIAFGHNITALSDLTGLMIGYNCGCVQKICC